MKFLRCDDGVTPPKVGRRWKREAVQMRGVEKRRYAEATATLHRIDAYTFMRRLCFDRGVPFALVWSECRLPSVARVRHEAMAVLRNSWGLSFHEVGIAVGRDHSTVMDGIEKHETRLMREFSEGRAA